MAPSTSSAADQEAAPFCVAVDWGTTSFRLWVLDGAGRILAESRGGEGMMRAAEIGFETVLERHLHAAGPPAVGLPIVICGMAGARQGWVEAPYVEVPTGLDGIAHRAVVVETRLGPTRILPGLCQRSADTPDVMRGEETQLLGLAIERRGSGDLVCMPGTHSKWVTLSDGRVAGFTTFMTGEIFDVVSRHSILTHAVEPERRARAEDPVFRDAAARARLDPSRALQGLFAIRAGHLLGLGTRAEGAARLSGLLIGAEIGAAFSSHPAPGEIVLVASGALADLYGAALADAGAVVRLADAEAATRRGLFEAARRIFPQPGRGKP